MKFAAVLVLGCFLAACGYHVSTGTGALMPKTAKTIAVSAFANGTTRYKLSDRLPDAIAREFITRTKYRIVPSSNAADLVISGAVLSYSFNPTIFDPTTGRASNADLHVYISVKMVERTSGKTLFNRPRFEVRNQNYTISQDAGQYFDESEYALSRAAQQVAQQLVTNIIEDF